MTNFNMTFAAQVERPEDDGGIPTSFNGICYSGGVVPGYGWLGDCAIDMSTVKAPTKEIFALINHDPDQRAGRLSIEVGSNNISIKDGKFFTTPDGRRVAEEFAQGAPWEFSVGFGGKIKVFEKPTKMSINDQEMLLDALFTHVHVREVSFVPAGADPNTSAGAFSIFGENEMSEVKEILDGVKSELDAAKGEVVELTGKLEVQAEALSIANSNLDNANVQIAELSSKIAEMDAIKAVLEAVKAERDELKAAIRLEAVKALFADTGKEETEANIAKYVSMGDETFALMSEELRSVSARKNIEGLFGEVATDGVGSDGASELDKAVAAILKQHPEMSREKAVVSALSANPALYGA